MNIHIDMPCTTDLHIGERAPDIAAIIFKDRNGCFEKPSLDKEPSFWDLASEHEIYIQLFWLLRIEI